MLIYTAYPNTSTGGNHYAPPSAPYQSQPQIPPQQQSGTSFYIELDFLF